MRSTGKSLLFLVLISTGILLPAMAGVSREVEDRYAQLYENKAMFLKIPVRGTSQVVSVLEGGSSLDRSSSGLPLTFKVGEQVRITDVSFKDSSVEFKISSLDGARRGTVIFQFRDPLRHSFPSQPFLDRTLEDSFTEGLSYQEIDSAKEQYVKDQFDVLLNQFALATGTSVEFVLESITEKNPHYRVVKKQLEESLEKARSLESELREERERSRSLLQQAEKAASDLTIANQSGQSLRRERDKLASELRESMGQMNQLNEENKRFQSQIENIAQKLNVQTNSNTKLGEQVASLGRGLDALKEERAQLTAELARANQELSDLKEDKGRLESDLKAAQRKSTKLQSDLGALTSNRDSLEATYLRTKQRKENLERADALAAAVRSDRISEERHNGELAVSGLYLHDQKIGTLEVELPSHPNQDFKVVFQFDSPDTVQFTEEERELYEALGEPCRVEIAWDVWSDHLEAVLVEGEGVQQVAPRETAEWVWAFRGELDGSERVALNLHFIDADEQVVRVLMQEYELNPSGALSQLGQILSIPSLLTGFILGLAVLGVILGVRGRTHSHRRRVEQDRQYPTQKKL